MKSLIWNTLPAGTTKFSKGTTAHRITNAANHVMRARPANKGAGCGRSASVAGQVLSAMAAGLRAAALHRKNALRAFLDEHNDEDQHRNFGEHGACPAF
jgi:hypothetical protein